MTTGWWTNWIGFVGRFGSRPARLPRGHVYVVVRDDRDLIECKSWREVERATAGDDDSTFVVIASAADYHARAEAWAT